MTRRALVVTHRGREEAVKATAEAVLELETAGFTPVLAPEDADAADLPPFELAVVLGGDGAEAVGVGQVLVVPEREVGAEHRHRRRDGVGRVRGGLSGRHRVRPP